MELASQPRPRFRTDLVAECIEADGQRFIDVIDPDTGDAFRFYEVEYSLACAMDGERDVVGLAQWAKEELGIEPSRSELETVITTLGDLGYLDRGTVQRDVELRPGVTAGRPEPRPMPSADVELGLAGGRAAPTSPPPMDREDVELGVAGGKPTVRMEEMVEDVELGMPGSTPAIEPMPSLRRGETRPDADEDGPTHLPAAAVGDFDDDEVSMDLSEHMSLGANDVKEAVRMSRSMKVVDVPPELLDEIGQKEAEAAARAEEMKKAAAAAARPVEPAVPMSKTVPVEPDVVARPAVELPKEPVVVSKKSTKPPERVDPRPEPKAEVKPVPPVEQKPGTSKFLIFLLVLAILGAGGFAVWKYVLNKPKDDAATTTSSKPVPAKPNPDVAKPNPDVAKPNPDVAKPNPDVAKPNPDVEKPTPPPPPAFATLEARGETVEVKGGKGGAVTFAVADGTEVQQGDPIVQYKGAAPLLIKLGNATSGLIYDIETRVPGEIAKLTKERDDAEAKGNKALAKAKQKKLDERTSRLEYKKGEADKLRQKIAALSVEAPAAGKVVSPVRKGAFVKPDDVIAKIDTGESLVATFDVKDQPGTPPAPSAQVRIANKDTPDQKANCQVTDVQGTMVTVTCAGDIGIPAGTTVVLDQGQ